MDGYFSKLMSEHSVTNVVIIRDDAKIAEHQQRPEFSPPPPPKEEPQREAFEHSPALRNSAPTLPSRKKSLDDLSLTLIRKGGSRHKRISLDDVLLTHGINNIVSNHKLPSVEEGSPSTEPKHLLFEDIFRDVDELLKQSVFD